MVMSYIRTWFIVLLVPKCQSLLSNQSQNFINLPKFHKSSEMSKSVQQIKPRVYLFEPVITTFQRNAQSNHQRNAQSNHCLRKINQLNNMDRFPTRSAPGVTNTSPPKKPKSDPSKGTSLLPSEPRISKPTATIVVKKCSTSHAMQSWIIPGSLPGSKKNCPH